MKNEISKLLKKKTSTFFKLSLFLFLFSFVLLNVSSILLFSRFEQLNADFIDNSNTHLIEINSFSGGPTITDPLAFDDIQNIKDQIHLKYNSLADVFTDYSINFGVTSSLNETFFVKSIDDDATFAEKTADFTALANQSFQEQKIVLYIPKIEINDAGFSSVTMTDMEILLKPTKTNQSPISDVNFHSDTIYVNQNTFKKTIEYMYGISWEEFVERYSSGEIFGINVVNKIYVYVHNLKNVKPIATTLNQAGYNTNYLLSGFHDLNSSIKSNVFIFIAIGVFIFLVTTVNTVIAFRNYFLLSKKDIGTLKFYGYTNSRIYQAYAANISNIFCMVQSAGAFVTLVFSVVFIKNNPLIFIISILLIQCILLLSIKTCVTKIFNKILKMDTLMLIQK